MRDKKRKAVIRILNQEIQKQFGYLQELLMLEADIELQNENCIPKNAYGYVDLKKIKEDKQNLLITISDLITICKALERRKENVSIYGSGGDGSTVLMETRNAVSAAGLNGEFF